MKEPLKFICWDYPSLAQAVRVAKLHGYSWPEIQAAIIRAANPQTFTITVGDLDRLRGEL